MQDDEETVLRVAASQLTSDHRESAIVSALSTASADGDIEPQATILLAETLQFTVPEAAEALRENYPELEAWHDPLWGGGAAQTGTLVCLGVYMSTSNKNLSPEACTTAGDESEDTGFVTIRFKPEDKKMPVTGGRCSTTQVSLIITSFWENRESTDRRWRSRTTRIFWSAKFCVSKFCVSLMRLRKRSSKPVSDRSQLNVHGSRGMYL